MKLKDILKEEEKSWKIKEKLPISVSIESKGKYFLIKVSPMKMKYDTFEKLGSGHRTQDIDVSYSSYDYRDGTAEFVASSKEDIDKWLNKYKKYVKK